MAKPKLDFKQLFMEKGEKITIIAAGVLMVLFLTLGILAIATSASTDVKQKEINDKVKGLETALNGTSGTVDPLDPALMGEMKYPTFVASQFRPTGVYVDLPLDSAKRGRPHVLPPDEFQVDLVRAPIYVYHFTPDRDSIYVLKELPKGKNLKAEEIGKRASAKKKTSTPAAGPPSSMAPSGPGMGGPGMGGPGMGGPGMGGPGMGGPGMGGPGSFPGGPGMMGGPGMGSMVPGMGSGATSAGALKDMGIVPEKISDFKSKPARFLRPVRMVVVEASFPYLKQLEEFKRALRYNSLNELFANTKDLPEFRGFNVQRQVRRIDTNAVVQPWAELDWIENYKSIYTEKEEEDYKDPEDLVKFKVIPDLESGLCLPLPMLSREKKYPPITMTSINNAVEKLKKAGEPPKTGPLGGDRFKGDTGPFGKGSSDKKPGSTGTDSSASKTEAPNSIQEAILIRFVDVNILPGYSYEYRIQLKIANPNLGKEKQVGRPEDATLKELIGPWSEVLFSLDGRKTSAIPVPAETYVYAYSHDTRTVSNKDHVRLQVQSWMPQVRTDKSNLNAVDDVGDWIVEDLEIGRGQYVAGVKNVKLPVWDPKHDRYQFKDMKGTRPGSTASALKGTVPVEFGAGALLVDFEGGKLQQQIKGRTIVDEPGVEMLLVTGDGKLVVRNSAADKHEANRLTREKDWLAWQEDTKKNTEPAKSTGTFDKPGGGGNKGGSN